MGKKVTTEIVPAAEVAKFKRGSAEIVKIADDLVVTTKVEENNAYDILKRIKALKKEIEDKRTSITKPLNTSLRAANALFKPLSLPLMEADSTIRGKILVWREAEEEKAAKQQAIRDKVRATKEAKGIETEPVKAVVPDVGESTTAKRWTYDVVNITKVPREYLALDTSVVWRAIRNGVRNIPGLDIRQEKSLRV